MTDEPRDPSAHGGDDADTADLDASTLGRIHNELADVGTVPAERRNAQLAAAMAAYDMAAAAEPASAPVDLEAARARRRPDRRVWLGRVAAAAVVVIAGAVGVRLATSSDSTMSDSTMSAGRSSAELDAGDDATVSKSAELPSTSAVAPEFGAGNVGADAAGAPEAAALPATGGTGIPEDLGPFDTPDGLAVAITERVAAPLTTLPAMTTPAPMPDEAGAATEGYDATESRQFADRCPDETALLGVPRFLATIGGAPVVAAARPDGDGIDVVRLDNCAVSIAGGR